MTTCSNRFACAGAITACALLALVSGCNNVQDKSGTVPSTTIGNKIDDSVVTTRVKSAMLADPAMKSLDVSVTTKKGEVQLSGFVDNAVQLTHAAEIAKGIEGVSSVVNQISIKK
jgi:hyperosmotically inducible periplasmic protein